MTTSLISLASFMLCFMPSEGEPSFREPSSAAANKGTSRMHKHQMMRPDMLDHQEREIYNKLTPTYQRIFLYALSHDQRNKVVYFVAHGKTPHEAINFLLNKESGLSPRKPTKKQPALTPAERAMDNNDICDESY